MNTLKQLQGEEGKILTTNGNVNIKWKDSLQELQEKMNEEFDEKFVKDTIMTNVRVVERQNSKELIDFLHQQITLSYNAGKADMLDTVLKEIDKRLNSIGRPVDGFPKEKYTNDTWVIIGKLEALDTLKNKLLDNKKLIL